MPHSLFVPDYDEDGRLITDQRQLRIRNESRTPEIDRLANQSLQARDEAIKAAHLQAEQKTKAEKEFQANAQAAAKYGIPPQALSPAGMGVAQMLDAEQELNARFEAKKQELAQKYQGPDAGNIVRELDELHQTQDRELAAKFANNPLAEQAIATRAQEFRSQAANWLHGEIQTKQQQYFDAVDKKCNDALITQISGMQPERFSGALATRENEMRALGRAPGQIQAAKQALIGSYFQNLAVTAPSAFFEAVKQPAAKEGAAPGSARPHAEGSALANKPQNILSRFAETLPEEELGRLSRMAEKTRTELGKKEEFAKINLRQQEILQELTGLDPAVQRAEIEKITAGMEERKMTDTLKTRLSLQLDYEDAVRAARDWETGTKILQEDFGPLEKLEAIATANISEAAREGLIREVMGEPAPETPENREAALDAIKKVGSGAIQSERQLYAICQQQGLTRSQAALLGDAFAGNGRVNGVPVGMAINALQQRDTSLANNPAALFGATERLLRDWPEGMMPTYKNVAEQTDTISQTVEHMPLENEISSIAATPFEQLLKKHGIIQPQQNNEFAGLLTGKLPKELLELPEIKQISRLNPEDEGSLLEELGKLEERQMISEEQRKVITLLFIQHQGERTSVMPVEGKLDYVDAIMRDYPDQASRNRLYAELRKKDPKAVFLDDKDMFAMLALTHGPDFAKDFARFQQFEIQARQKKKELAREAQILSDERTRVGTGDKRYKQLIEETEKINLKLETIESERMMAWDKLQSDYPFQRVVPEAFYREQAQMGNQWKNALKAKSEELGAYASRIKDAWQNKNMPEEQRKQLVRKELQEMLNFARANMDIRDAHGKPVTGKLELKDFGPGVSAKGMAEGNDIYINERPIFEGENIDFGKVLGTLFHESGHVHKNNMPPEKRRQVFGSNVDCYMPPSVSNDLYRLQPTELHGFYLETFADEIF